MKELLRSSFCDLFGFNNQGFPVVRLPIKIDKVIIQEDSVIEPDIKIGGFVISKHIDDYAVVYYDEDGQINLHMFILDDCTNKAFCNCKPEKRLYKYGRKIYLREVIENGIFKIFPALTYLKMENDEARQDNEFIATTLSDGSNFTASFLDKRDSSIKKIIPSGNVKNSYIMTVDFYMLCLSYAYDESLYKVFKNSDSCLIIKEPTEFSERMHTAFNKQYPGYIGIDARVSYGNCLSPLGTLFTKDKRFLLQREYRFVWMPEHCEEKLDPIKLQNNNEDYLATLIEKPLDLYVGDLSDIVELVDRPF